jgi:hypothetical protein
MQLPLVDALCSFTQRNIHIAQRTPTCSVSCWCASSLASATAAAGRSEALSGGPVAAAGGRSGVSASCCVLSSSHCAVSYTSTQTARSVTRQPSLPLC